jgi:hypothetical protein
MKFNFSIFLFISIIILSACGNSSEEQRKKEEQRIQDSINAAIPSSINEEQGQLTKENNFRKQQTNRSSSRINNEPNEILEDNNTISGCRFDDGLHYATVYYSNSETGYSATYSLDVEVQDCQIVQINFPNNGYLDEDHITYADIDESGNATVESDEGKTFEIHIEN